MRRLYPATLTLTVCCALMLFCSTTIYAQDYDSRSATSLIKQHALAIGLSANDLQNLRISDAYTDKKSQMIFVYAQQTFKGIDVMNSIQTFAFKQNKLVSAMGGRVSGIENLISSKDGKATVLAADAVRTAASHLKLAVPGALSIVKNMNDKKEIEFSKLDISNVNVKAKLLWLPVEEESMLLPAVPQKKIFLTWQITIQPKGKNDYWLVNVDAVKGTFINKINLNIECDWRNPRVLSNEVNKSNIAYNINTADDNAPSLVNSSRYRVIPFPAESPAHPGGTPAVRQNPWGAAGAGNDATTLQWHDNGTTTFDSTRGNNVLAQEDLNGNNGNGKGAVSTTAQPNLTFNFKPNFNADPTTAANQNFAITNLFYANNIIHDIAYQYGFTEAAGNFQANNLSRGGAGNDYVLADAQDGSGTNNANFATPADGSSPRMQMFLWNGGASVLVKKPTQYAGAKTAVESGFSTNNKILNVGPVTGRVVLYADDAGNTTHLACGASANPTQLAGRIALIDRGTCDFVTKVKNAQNAGAIGVIVADNIPGEYPIIMGGTDNTITIPAFMVSYETGDSMKLVLSLTPNLNITMRGTPNIDGDLDNGIITHEYTHGISNRLTGGPNNVGCLGNKEQMGEGWSDFMALMLVTDWSTATVNDGPKPRPIGTYALNQPNNGSGIRYYPYSTNFAVNPWTYDSMALSSRFSNGILSYSPHNVGEVWCTMLWNMTWEIIKQTGNIEPNIYASSSLAGNTVALQLVMQGMKLQPCSPGFVDGRDAILRADTLLYGGVHSAAIWKAFASRGLGVNAAQNSTNNIKDGVADYTLPSFTSIAAATVADNSIKNNVKIMISPNPATDKISLTVPGNTKALKVSLIDATGRQIKTVDLKNSYIDIMLPRVAPGMYYIKITGENMNYTQKLVIE